MARVALVPLAISAWVCIIVIATRPGSHSHILTATQIYGQDMGANVAEDVKYNYGLMLLRGLCKGWVLAHGGPQALQSTGPEGAVPETTPCPEVCCLA